MSPLFKWAVRLYPAAWRRRYAHELEALLEDMDPGARELWDVLREGVTMRITTLGTTPVVCAIAGALIGGLLALRTPIAYASSATISLASSAASAAAPRRDELVAAVEGALAGANPRQTSVMLLHDRAGRTTLRVTCADPRPDRARSMAAAIATAIVNGPTARARGAALVEQPSRATRPVPRPYASRVLGGSVVGLATGGVLLLVARRRANGSR